MDVRKKKYKDKTHNEELNKLYSSANNMRD
jgi:hypothetical protein